jgi:4-amino-4-deoxy-L-arabinose transferase-like glycosyltransferase
MGEWRPASHAPLISPGDAACMSTNVTRWPALLPSRRQSATLRRMWLAAITRERVALAGLLVGTAILFTWNLAASGWANAYYSAAVQAGSKDWLAMLFGSFDAGNAITVDKTPASLWVMELSARMFGFSSWSVLLPQAVEGVLAVWLLYLAVRRRFGPMAGLAAGAVLALTPVATLMFRYNNPDALLTLLLVAATYATIRALEQASTRWLVVAGVAIGFAFLAKMLQGFVLVPTFALVYLLAAPTSLWRRVRQVGAAAAAVVISAGWWMALVLLWPSAARPYIGGSQTDSIVDLMLGYNGLGRITGDEVGRVGGGGGGPFSQDAGWLRLFNGELASQVSWLIPAALVALVAVLWLRRRLPRTDLARAQLLLWGGWLVTTGLVFSLMQGIFHSYYAVVLAPAIGALVGIGVATALRLRRRLGVRLLSAATVIGSAAWTAVLLARSPDWFPWLGPVVLAASFGLAAAVLLGTARQHQANRFLLSAAMAVLLAAPAFGSIATAAQPHTGAIPTAEPTVEGVAGPGGAAFGPGAGLNGRNGARTSPFGLPGFTPRNGGFPNGSFPNGGPPGFAPRAGFGGGGGGQAGGANGGLGGLLDAGQTNGALVTALQQDADAYRWVAATTGANSAAGVALSSGESVMGIGGFNGTDPSPTLEEFQAYVAAGEIHYYLAGANATGFAGAQGGSEAASQIASWVAANFEATTIGGVNVYDLVGAA